MRTRLLGSIGLIVVMLAAGLPCFAQEESAAAELQLLNRHTEEVMALLRTLIEDRGEELKLRKLEVAVLALQLRSGALDDLEAQRRRLQERKTSSEEELGRMRQELEGIEGLIEAEEITDGERSQLQGAWKRVDSEVKLIEDRVWQLDRSVVDLENDIERKRRDVDHLEELVANGLSDL
jgi:chromosome segregation ATPase